MVTAGNRDFVRLERRKKHGVCSSYPPSRCFSIRKHREWRLELYLRSICEMVCKLVKLSGGDSSQDTSTFQLQLV